jgi:hypothetical protein
MSVVVGLFAACSSFSSTDTPAQPDVDAGAPSDAGARDGGGAPDADSSASNDAAPQPDAGGDPDLLATGEAHVYGLAVDSQALYWVRNPEGTIRRQLLAAPGPTTTYVDTMGTPVSINAAGGKLYVADQMNGQIGVVDTATNTSVFKPQPAPRVVVPAAGEIYFIQMVNGVSANGASVDRTPSLSAMPTTFSDSNGPADLATDGTTVFWVDSDCSVNAWTGAADGGVPALYGSFGQGCRSIAVTPTYVYVTGSATGSVWRIPKGNPAGAQKIASNESKPGAIVADDNIAYWLDIGTGELRLWDTTVASGDQQATAPDYFHGLAMDAKYVYRVSYDAGTIRRVAR